MKTTALHSDQVLQLLLRIEESIRVTSKGMHRFIEPKPNTLQYATSRRHHLFFGRRGSGKSTVLFKAMEDLDQKYCPTAYVNLEVYKTLSCSDILINVLIRSFRGFGEWLVLHLNDYPARPRLKGRLASPPLAVGHFDRVHAQRFLETLDCVIADLQELLHSPAKHTIKVVAEQQDAYKLDGKARGGFRAGLIKMGGMARAAVRQGNRHEQRGTFTVKKARSP